MHLPPYGRFKKKSYIVKLLRMIQERIAEEKID